MDGTLLDTLQDLACTTNELLRAHGYPEYPVKDYCYFVGSGIRILIERVLPEKERVEPTLTRLCSEFVVRYEQHKEKHTAPYPGIGTLLQALQKQGILLAIASNKVHEAMQPLVEHYFPGIDFAAIRGNRQGIPVKPHPAIVENILQMTRCTATEALYVGDTAIDMQTAAAAGIRKIGVTWGFRPVEELENAGADFIANTPTDILSFICKNIENE